MGRRAALAVGLALLAVGLAGVAAALTSPNYDATWSRFASGGGELASTSYRVQDILGLWAWQTTASANYRIETTFFAPEPGLGALQLAALAGLAARLGLQRRRRARRARAPTSR